MLHVAGGLFIVVFRSNTYQPIALELFYPKCFELNLIRSTVRPQISPTEVWPQSWIWIKFVNWRNFVEVPIKTFNSRRLRFKCVIMHNDIRRIFCFVFGGGKYFSDDQSGDVWGTGRFPARQIDSIKVGEMVAPPGGVQKKPSGGAPLSTLRVEWISSERFVPNFCLHWEAARRWSAANVSIIQNGRPAVWLVGYYSTFKYCSCSLRAV